VPIYLAIIPVLAGAAGGLYYFHVAFIVVLSSLLLQGWTVPWVARSLGVEVPPVPEPAARFDLFLPSQTDRDIVAYRAEAGSPIVGKPLETMALPKRTRILTVMRDQAVVPRGEIGAIEAGDDVLLICPPEHAHTVDRLFLPRARRGREPGPVQIADFTFHADAPFGAVALEYRLPFRTDEHALSVGDVLTARLGGGPSVGDAVRIGDSDLIVMAMAGGKITLVGLKIEPPRVQRVPALAYRWLVVRARRLIGRKRPPERRAPG